MNQEHFRKYPPTPRIYYREEKLCGKALKTEVINVVTFDFILENAGNRLLKKSPENALVPQGESIVSEWIEPFMYVTLSDDGISYDDAEQGHFYLPKALVFYDVADFRFPTSFYFLAKINNEVELCNARGGDECQWHNMLSRITPVGEATVIGKVEATLKGLKDRISYEVEQKTETRRDGLLSAVMEAYSSLLAICMPQSARKEAVRGIIESLKNHDAPDDTGDIFQNLLRRVNNDQIPFFITIDWNTSIDELNEWVRDGVKENFGQTVEFLEKGEDGGGLIVSDRAGFPSFSEKLQKFGLQFSFVDTGNDEYVFIIHPEKDLRKVTLAFDALGLDYQSLAELYK